MIDAGLLEEVCDIYNPNANYTLGLRQAIGVREFENFLGVYFSDSRDDKTSDSSGWNPLKLSTRMGDKSFKENIRGILNSSSDNLQKILLEEAIDKVKANTRRLVRRQKRRLNQLQTLFGWNINFVDATGSISSKSDERGAMQVVEPAVKIITSFLNEDNMTESESAWDGENKTTRDTLQKDLWTQYTCKACGEKVLRGAHEWEQHRQGRGHRRRMSRLQRSQSFCP